MPCTVVTAGVRVGIDCALPHVAALLDEALAGEERLPGFVRPDVVVHVDTASSPFSVGDLSVLTRDVRAGNGRVHFRNVCTSGFDLLVDVRTFPVQARLRWRPPARDRIAHALLVARFHLLARAVLLHYPALWVAGLSGHVPLHVSGVMTPAGPLVLAGPGGVGKSTLLAAELADGARATSDNVCVTDGRQVWGLVEPLRVKKDPAAPGAHGRRVPHQRRERPFPDRVSSLVPDRILVVVRGSVDTAQVLSAGSREAARSLVTGTYVAGELRRYWGYAAALAAGTGLGPAHPDIGTEAIRLAESVPCSTLVLPRRPGTRLIDVLDSLETDRL